MRWPCQNPVIVTSALCAIASAYCLSQVRNVRSMHFEMPNDKKTWANYFGFSKKN